jgi:carbon-monoxide dehydrogenase medium subunit
MLETSSLVQTHIPLLTETFQQVASIRIRTVATVGGALAHADPNQDPPPALLVLDARVHLRSQQRNREVAISDFFTGYYETVMEPDELITAVLATDPR